MCGYCASTVVRNGDQLQRIGKMAELFDDFSPLQLMATGSYEGKAFTVVGRLQYAWTGGAWNEWHCAFDQPNEAGNTTAWLSEDNGQYVLVRDKVLARTPELAGLRAGASTAFEGKRYQITAVTLVHLSGAQGELPKMPALNREFTVVELRADDGAVLTLDDGNDAVCAYAGFGVGLAGLQLQGLRDLSETTDKQARQFACPHCGAQIALKLDSTKAVSCPSCASVIDTSQGVGHEVLSALQTEPVKPIIALGSEGSFQSVKWQVVGFQHRMGFEAGDDERFGWDEYLLYNRTEGFAFVVDATDGWSFVRPLSGAPDYRAGAAAAKYLGKTYAVKYHYDAETTYVAGEFYWRASRGARSSHSDFSNGFKVLSREQTQVDGAQEITWSLGEQVDADDIAKAFGLKDQAKDLQRDVAPFSGNAMSVKTLIILVLVFLLVALMLSRCSSSKCDPQREDCSKSSYRSSGGSYGGWSGGSGGHK